MSQFIVWTSVVIITLVAALMLMMPALVRPTLPLGVSVPQARVDEPIVRTSIRRYRMAVVGAWVVGVALTLIMVAGFPIAASIVPFLVALVLGVIAYVVARGAIIRAKRDGRWYENVPVRLSAQITTKPVQSHPPFGWIIAAVAVLLAVMPVGVAVYPGVPNPTPVHWNAAGEVDRYAAKSVWTVFGPVLIGLGAVALLFACTFLVRLAPLRAAAIDAPADRDRRTARQRSLMSSLLGQLAVVVAVLIGWLTIVGWLAPRSAGLMVAGVVLLLMLLLAVIVIFAVRYRSAVASWGATDQHGRPDAPDDDRFWTGGLIYINRDDPAVFVPKRFGVGWTVNLGSIGGIALGVGVLLVIAAAIVIAILVPGAAHTS